ncbi:hypothetical protein GCM10023080_060880 [Streptomyces pseudoechinosporeus]
MGRVLMALVPVPVRVLVERLGPVVGTRTVRMVRGCPVRAAPVLWRRGMVAVPGPSTFPACWRPGRWGRPVAGVALGTRTVPEAVTTRRGAMICRTSPREAGAARAVPVARSVRAVPRGRPVDRSRVTGRWRRLPVPGGRGVSEALRASVVLAGSVVPAGLAVRESRVSMVLPVDRVGRVLPEGPVDPAPRPVARGVPEVREAPVPRVPRTVRAPRMAPAAPADPAPQPVVPAAPVTPVAA